jgi:TolA-binding protein
LKDLGTRFPNDPIAAKTKYRAAEIAYEKNEWDLAGELFASVVKAGGDGPHGAAALSGLGWSQFQSGKYRESAETFASVLKQYPDDAILAPESAYKHAEALQKAESLPEAAAAYSAAFDKFSPAKPAEPGAEQKGKDYYAYRAGLQAARLLRSLGEVDKADSAYEALLERFPQPVEKDKLLDEWALLNYESKRFERSDEIFRRLVKEVPESELADDARLSLAESRLIAGNLDEARKAFGELEASERSSASVREVALKHLVGIAIEQRNWAEAESRADRFLAAYPRSKYRWDVQLRLGEARVHSEKYESARKSLAEIRSHAADPGIKQADWAPRVWILLAEVAVRQKKYDEVAALVEELRRDRPGSPLNYQADEILGRSLKNQAKFAEARAALSRVVEDEHGRRTETAAKSQFMIADTYLLQKQFQDAQREYLKVYVLYKFPEWQSAALFYAGTCDEALGQWTNAIKSYEDLVREFPESEFAGKAKAQLPIARRKAAG